VNVPESNVTQADRIWLFYDRDGEFVTHDRFATLVEAEAFAAERNLLFWMPPISSVGWNEVPGRDRPNRASTPDAAYPAPGASSMTLLK
jgi:hypothetical protein